MDDFIATVCDYETGSDTETITAFLLSYRFVLPPEDLLDRLKCRFELEPEPNSMTHRIAYLTKWRPIIQMRILSLIRRWIDECWFDFENNPLISAIQKFFEFILQKEELRQEVKNATTGLQRLIQIKTAFHSPNIMQPQAQDSKKNRLEFHEVVSDKEIAYCLTKEELQKFQNVKPIEFFLYTLGSKSPEVAKVIQNLKSWINDFNTMSYWVATEVCTQPDIKVRAQVIERMINIAKVM